MATTGLRERKKRQTRTALRSAALRLVADHGLDAVTVDDIAAAADVSPRTFFNYFSSKEEAIVGSNEEGMAELAALVAERPAREEPLVTLHAVLGAIAGTLADDREAQILRRTVLANHPSLLPRHIAAFVEFERVLVAAISQRPTPKPTSTGEATLVVALAVTALRVSVDQWLADAGRSDLPLLFDATMSRLARGLVSPKTRLAVSPTAAHVSEKMRQAR